MVVVVVVVVVVVAVVVVAAAAAAAMSLSTITTLLLFNSISPGQTTATSSSLHFTSTPGESSVVWRNRTNVDRCFSDRHDCDLHLE